MPFRQDIITQAQSQSRPLPSGLGGEEGLEDLIFYFSGDTGAVVGDLYFDSPRPPLQRGGISSCLDFYLGLLDFGYGLEGIVENI